MNLSTRRVFLKGALSSFALVFSGDYLAAGSANASLFTGVETFTRIVQRARAGRWRELSMSSLMGKVALELVGVPYKGGTLEIFGDSEKCSVNLNTLDCVTFVESTMALARMIKAGGDTPADLISQVAFIRYREGKPGDYSTRLHYTSDWLFDNQQKHVIELLTHLPGSETYSPRVDFMTNHPHSYRQLNNHPELIAKLKQQEDAINQRGMTYIPLDRIAGAEPFLKTGDVVGVCTKQPGLDITHMGLVWRDEKNVAHFMDASSSKSNMKVTIEPGPISGSLKWSKDLIGAIFARPLDLRQHQ